MEPISEDIRARDLLDTRGAARLIASRQGKPAASVDTVHLLVRDGRLRAYKFGENGTLVEHRRGEGRSTESLFFVRADVETVPLPLSNRGRPPKTAQ